jgi:hypothetical protein
MHGIIITAKQNKRPVQKYPGTGIKERVMDIVAMINKYGFPIVAAFGMGYMIYFVWKWATQEVKPVLKEANTVLIALIDRIRMLDNDLIRLNQKVNIVLMLRDEEIYDRLNAEKQKSTKDNNDESKG